ncbi:sugar ABC transporter substrate-binding protein [Caproiciproducens sp.]
MKKWLKKTALFLAACMLLGAAGCSDGAGSSATGGTQSAVTSGSADNGGTAKSTSEVGKKRAILLVKKLSSTFWTDLQEGAKAQCEEYGWTLETLSPTKPDNNEEQIQLLEQSLNNPPDVYLIAAADSKGITPAIEKINEAGIPIIAVSAKLTDEGVDYVTFVGVEFYDLAKQAAEAIAEECGNKGNILMLTGTTGSSSAQDIERGATEVFGKTDMKILASQPANYLRTEGLTVTQNLLQKYQDVDVIFAANGESALGAAEAVRQSGRKGIKIATMNMSKELAQAIQNGTIELTVDDVSGKIGQEGVVAAMKYFQGEKLEKDTLQQGIVVKKDTIQSYKTKYGI